MGKYLSIRLTQSVLAELSLTDGAIVDVAVDSNKIILSLKKADELKELLQNVTPKMQHEKIK